MMFDSVKEIILGFAEPDFEITRETRLKSDLGLTSFDLICLADRLTGLSGTQISDRQMRECETVGDLCDVAEAAVC